MLRPAQFLGCFVAPALLAGSIQAATLYGFAIEDTSEPKWTTGIELFYDDGAVGSISQSWLIPDLASATAYVASLLDHSDRDSILGSYLLSVSMGTEETRSESLRMAVERWVADPGSQDFRWEIIAGDRYGGDGRRESADEVPQWYGDNICSCWESSDPSDFSVVAIPEPSAALLGALGGLALLRRRRIA